MGRLQLRDFYEQVVGCSAREAVWALGIKLKAEGHCTSLEIFSGNQRRARVSAPTCLLKIRDGRVHLATVRLTDCQLDEDDHKKLGDVLRKLVLRSRIEAELQRETLRHAQMARRLNRRLQVARHDLKTPLVAMKGYVDMMLKGLGGAINSTQQRYLERVRHAVNREHEIINETLC